MATLKDTLVVVSAAIMCGWLRLTGRKAAAARYWEYTLDNLPSLRR